jgi:putative transposase
VARILRRDLPDGYFHVTACSVDEAPLVQDAADARMLISLLRRAVCRFRLGLHVYCVMGTHYHALVDGRVKDLSRAVQWLQSVYAREHNARHGRAGALFRERFSSWVIRDEEHYRAAFEYILDNPVRAGLVQRAEDWPWSGAPGRKPRSHAQTPGAKAGARATA